MKKAIEDMSDRELLEELIAEKRRADKVRYVKYAVWAVILIALAYLLYRYLPPVIKTVQEIRQATQQIEQELGKLNDNIESIRGTVDGIRQSGSDALERAIEKLNSLLENWPFKW